MISNKIRTDEEGIAKNQVKINEHIKLEQKIEHSIEEIWKLVESTNTENKWYQVGKKGRVIFTSKNNETISGQKL